MSDGAKAVLATVALLAAAIVTFGVALMLFDPDGPTGPQPAASLQQQPSPWGTVTQQAGVIGTQAAQIGKCGRNFEAAYLAAWSWYTTTLAMQTACPDAGVATPVTLPGGP